MIVTVEVFVFFARTLVAVGVDVGVFVVSVAGIIKDVDVVDGTVVDFAICGSPF